MTRGEFVRAVIEQQKQNELMHDAEDELYHYGRKGMKWGENVFENNPITDGIDRMKAEHQKNKLLREAKKRQENERDPFNQEKYIADMNEQTRRSPNKSIYDGSYYDVSSGKTKTITQHPANHVNDTHQVTGAKYDNLSDYRMGFDEIDEEVVPPSERADYESRKQASIEWDEEQRKEKARKKTEADVKAANKVRRIAENHFGEDTVDKVAERYDKEQSHKDSTSEYLTDHYGESRFARNFIKEGRKEDTRNRRQEAAERQKALEEKTQNEKNDNTHLIDRFGESRFNEYVHEGRGMDKSDRERRNNRKRNQIFHTAIKDLVDY